MGLPIAAEVVASVFTTDVCQAAVYDPGGAALPVRVFLSVVDDPIDFGGAAVRAPGHYLLVSQAAVPSRPPVGVTITVGAATYRVRDVHNGPQDAVWVCHAARE